MRTKYTHSFHSIYFYNRWRHAYPPDNWCIIGIQQWWFSPYRYEIRFCLFGLEMCIKINRTFVEPIKQSKT